MRALGEMSEEVRVRRVDVKGLTSRLANHLKLCFHELGLLNQPYMSSIFKEFSYFLKFGDDYECIEHVAV